jgi:hypothetical protein
MQHHEITPIVTAAATLDELLEIVTTLTTEQRAQVDMADLPLFGGEQPTHSIEAVWSWDATRLLIGEGWHDLRIVSRSDYADLLASN